MPLTVILTAMPIEPEDVTSVMTVLHTIDWIIAVLTPVVVIGWTVWLLKFRRHSASAFFPDRPNTLREDAVAAAVAAYLLAIILLSTVVKMLGIDPETVVGAMAIGNGAQIAGIVACAVIASRRFAGGLPAFIAGPNRTTAQAQLTDADLPVRGNRVLLTACVLVVALGICPIVSEITVRVVQYVAPDFDLPLHPTLQALQDGDLRPIVSVMLWIGALVIAPVAEEFFFRGIMQTVLVNVFASRPIAIGLTALVFGLVHFTQPHAVVALVVLAALIGYAYERTGSLVVAIALHTAFNLKTLIWDALGG